MIIFDNISSLILFKHEFTAPLVKCLFFFPFFFEVQANFHHQMLVEPGFFLFWFQVRILSRRNVKESCLLTYDRIIPLCFFFCSFICLPSFLVISVTTFSTSI